MEHIEGLRGLEGQSGHGKSIIGSIMMEGKGPWDLEQPGHFPYVILSFILTDIISDTPLYHKLHNSGNL